MATTNIARLTEVGPPLPAMGTISAAANQYFAKGTIVQRDTAGRAVSPSTADVSGLPAAGVSIASFNNLTGSELGGAADAQLIEVAFGTHAFDVSGTTPAPGQKLFIVDNQTVSIDSLNGTRGFAGVCSEVQVQGSVTQVFCLFGPVAQAIALTEVSTRAKMDLPIVTGLVVSTGAPMAVFASGASTVPGVQIGDAKSAVVRWNNDAAPGAIAINVPYPENLDDTAAIVFHALVSKSGANSSDATSLTVAAFEVLPGSLDDADTDFGGATTAIVGTATAKTVTEVTLTLAAADVHPYSATLALQIKPTAGLLATDDLLLHSAWLEYTKKAVS